MILVDVVRNLRTYDQHEVSYQEATLYVAEPWGPSVCCLIVLPTPPSIDDAPFQLGNRCSPNRTHE
jgi:hypothetical protein